MEQHRRSDKRLATKVKLLWRMGRRPAKAEPLRRPAAKVKPLWRTGRRSVKADSLLRPAEIQNTSGWRSVAKAEPLWRPVTKAEQLWWMGRRPVKARPLWKLLAKAELFWRSGIGRSPLKASEVSQGQQSVAGIPSSIGLEKWRQENRTGGWRQDSITWR